VGWLKNKTSLIFNHPAPSQSCNKTVVKDHTVCFSFLDYENAHTMQPIAATLLFGNTKSTFGIPQVLPGSHCVAGKLVFH
jgi:hypothetical protein